MSADPPKWFGAGCRATHFFGLARVVKGQHDPVRRMSDRPSEVLARTVLSGNVSGLVTLKARRRSSDLVFHSGSRSLCETFQVKLGRSRDGSYCVVERHFKDFCALREELKVTAPTIARFCFPCCGCSSCGPNCGPDQGGERVLHWHFTSREC